MKTKFKNITTITGNRVDTTRFPNYPFYCKIIKHRPRSKFGDKVLKNYVFKTMEEADKCADDFIQLQKNKEKEKSKRREAKKNVKASDFYKIGDIVYNSWGYEQTNISFYQVIDIKPKTIVVQHISQEIVKDSMESNGMSCDVVAIKDSFLEEKFNLRVGLKGMLTGGESFYYFSKWDGKPKYKSWYY